MHFDCHATYPLYATDNKGHGHVSQWQMWFRVPTITLISVYQGSEVQLQKPLATINKVTKIVWLAEHWCVSGLREQVLPTRTSIEPV